MLLTALIVWTLFAAFGVFVCWLIWGLPKLLGERRRSRERDIPDRTFER